MIVVDHPAALADTAIKIELRGFPPRRPVRLTATQIFPNATRWQANATFTSDDHGCVDVTRQPPLAGSYDGIAAMGLFWSAVRLPGERRIPPVGSIMTPRQVHLEAICADGTQATATLERRVARADVSRHEIRVDGVVGTLFLPAGAGPHPAVIALTGGVGGLNEYWGAMLASHGYAALALGYFNVAGLPRGLVNIALEYFENAIRWMRAQSWLLDHFLAVWGPSRGGELALLLGATFAEINAVIAWVPSGVLFWGTRPSRARGYAAEGRLDVSGEAAAVPAGEQRKRGRDSRGGRGRTPRRLDTRLPCPSQ